MAESQDSNLQDHYLNQNQGKPRTAGRWSKQGFVLVSDGSSQPLMHGWYPTRWEAEADERDARDFPEHLRRNLRIVPSSVTFDA